MRYPGSRWDYTTGRAWCQDVRRANGTGGIIDLGSGRRRRYAVRVSHCDRPGHWVQRYIGYYATIREAQAALDEYNAEGRPPESRGVTVGELYAAWSERKSRKVSESAMHLYRASWKRVGVLADMEISKVTLDSLQSIIDAAEAAGLGSRSIAADKTLMNAIFRYAMERGIISKDWSALVELPTYTTKYEKGAFTEEQVDKLKEMAAGGVPWSDSVLILCYTGFRISELLALTPDDYHEEGGITWLQGGMKTEAGKNRIVPVHPVVQPYVNARLAEGGERIICRNGAAVRAQWYRYTAFPPVAQALGTPQATPHWCRHTAASRMRMAGVDALAVKRILGHADGSVTDHYTHLDLEFLAREIRKVP